MDGNANDGAPARRLARRQLLRQGALLGGALMVGGLLQACSASRSAPPSPPTPTTAPAVPTQAAPVGAQTQAPAAVAQPSAAAQPPAQAAGTPKRGGVLVIGRTTDATSLEPHKDASTGRAWTTQLMYNYVVQVDKDAHIVPDLAERWEIAPDTKTYTFFLRKGVKFHNGRELVAADVKYSLERIVDPNTAAYGRGFFSSIDGIETPDQYTVRCVLKNPDAALLASLASSYAGIVAKEEVDKGGGALTKSDGGSGPFMLDEWTPGQAVKLKRFPDFYDKDHVYLDGITFQVIPEETAVIAQLRSGGVHFAALLDSKNYDLVKDDQTLTALRSPQLGFQYMNIDNRKEPFDKLEVRQAMSWAIDRKAVLQGAVAGLGQLTAPIPPALKDYALDPLTRPEYQKPDLDKARELLASAGLPNGFKSALQVIVGFPLNINGGQVIADNLKKVGIELDIQQVEYGTWIKGFQNHEFILTMNGTAGNADPEPLLSPRLGSKGANNNSWQDQEVDDLLEQGKATADVAKRKEIYTKVQHVLLDRSPQIWLYTPDLIEVMKRSVKGYQSNPTTFTPGLQTTWLESA